MKVYIIGAGHTKFGELWNTSLTDLLAQSQTEALDNAQIPVEDINSIMVENEVLQNLVSQLPALV